MMRAVDVERRTDHVHRAEEGEPLYVIPVDIGDERSAMKAAIHRAGTAVAAQPGAEVEQDGLLAVLFEHDRGSVAAVAHGILVERGSGPSHTVKGQPHRCPDSSALTRQGDCLLLDCPSSATVFLPAARCVQPGTAGRVRRRLRPIADLPRLWSVAVPFALAAGTSRAWPARPLQPIAGPIPRSRSRNRPLLATVATDSEQVPNGIDGFPDTQSCSP